MSATGALVILFVFWALIGVVAAAVMSRRGHALYPWMFIGIVLGPLVIPVIVTTMRAEQTAPAPPVDRSAPRGQQLAVLVGVDGSEDAKGALVTAIALLGTRIGRLTIATVLDYDLERTLAGREEQENAREMLTAHARLAADRLGRDVETALLSGRPADALVQHARAAHDDVIIVSPRGKGAAARMMFGSVASQLARGVGLPVIILPPASE
jgi:nucleotide-binding universal stress UspA family protein